MMSWLLQRAASAIEGAARSGVHRARGRRARGSPRSWSRTSPQNGGGGGGGGGRGTHDPGGARPAPRRRPARRRDAPFRPTLRQGGDAAPQRDGGHRLGPVRDRTWGWVGGTVAALLLAAWVSGAGSISAFTVPGQSPPATKEFGELVEADTGDNRLPVGARAPTEDNETVAAVVAWTLRLLLVVVVIVALALVALPRASARATRPVKDESWPPPPRLPRAVLVARPADHGTSSEPSSRLLTLGTHRPGRRIDDDAHDTADLVGAVLDYHASTPRHRAARRSIAGPFSSTVVRDPRGPLALLPSRDLLGHSPPWCEVNPGEARVVDHLRGPSSRRCLPCRSAAGAPHARAVARQAAPARLLTAASSSSGAWPRGLTSAARRVYHLARTPPVPSQRPSRHRTRPEHRPPIDGDLVPGRPSTDPAVRCRYPPHPPGLPLLQDYGARAVLGPYLRILVSSPARPSDRRASTLSHPRGHEGPDTSLHESRTSPGRPFRGRARLRRQALGPSWSRRVLSVGRAQRTSGLGSLRPRPSAASARLRSAPFTPDCCRATYRHRHLRPAQPRVVFGGVRSSPSCCCRRITGRPPNSARARAMQRARSPGQVNLRAAASLHVLATATRRVRGHLPSARGPARPLPAAVSSLPLPARSGRLLRDARASAGSRPSGRHRRRWARRHSGCVRYVTDRRGLRRYCVAARRATRSQSRRSAPPRGAHSLMLVARAYAVIRGRDVVTPDDASLAHVR